MMLVTSSRNRIRPGWPDGDTDLNDCDVETVPDDTVANSPDIIKSTDADPPIRVVEHLLASQP